MKSSQNHRRHNAFTVLELLVALTIVSILCAVLIPSYGSVKRRAQSIRCINNLRQIGTAMMLYTSDSGHLPHSSHLKLWCDWGELLIPYMDRLTQNDQWVPGEPWACGLYKMNDGSFQHLGNEVGQGVKNPVTGQVYTPGFSYFTCPSASSSRQPASYKGQNGVHIYSHSYSCNEYVFPYGRWSNSPLNYPSEASAETAYMLGDYLPFPAVRPAELERPGSLIVVCDSGVDVVYGEASDTMFGPMYFTTQPGSPDNPSGIILGGIVDGFVTSPDVESTQGGQPVTTSSIADNDEGGGYGWPVYSRHMGHCNALMGDGHVESFKNGEMKRRNFVSRGRTKRWGGAVGYVDAYYP